MDLQAIKSHYGAKWAWARTGALILFLVTGILLVASGVGIGHGLLLRRDGNLRPDGEDADDAAVAARTRTLRLRLSGPADGFDAALAALGSVTPPGYALDIEPEAGVDR